MASAVPTIKTEDLVQPRQFARFDVVGTLVADSKTGKTYMLAKTKTGKPYVKFRIKTENTYNDNTNIEYFMCTAWGTLAEQFAKAGHKVGDYLGASGYFRITKSMNGSEIRYFTNLDAQAIRTIEDIVPVVVTADLDSFEGQVELEG